MRQWDLSNAHPLPFHPLWMVILVPLLWIAVTYLLGSLSGWRKLHSQYGSPPGEIPKGVRIGMAQVGAANYKNALRVAYDPFGIYLSVMFLFRTGHPPLFIPWSEIGAVGSKDLLWMERVRFDVGRPKITSITLPRSVVKGTH